MVLGYTERIGENLFENLQMRLLVEALIERKDGARKLEAVSYHLQLGGCGDCVRGLATVFDFEVAAGSVGSLAHPQEGAVLPLLEEKQVVAGISTSQTFDLSSDV